MSFFVAVEYCSMSEPVLKKRKPNNGQKEKEVSESVPLGAKDSKETNEVTDPSESQQPETTSKKQVTSCPYLGTVNRHLLDLDFQKLCSVTLSNQHVYCCLVCGKYLQGRGTNTLACTHALEENHFVFMNLQDARVYCLPDNYEIEDTSLADIQCNLHPVFRQADVAKLDTQVMHGKALDGSDFIPGLVGLNAINKSTDYANCVVQLLCVIAPLRNFFLLLDVRHKQRPDPVVVATADLLKKIFNPKNFKGIVCPHEFLQAITTASGKQFSLMKQSNVFEFLTWLLNHLHMKLRKKDSGLPPRQQRSVVADALSGTISTYNPNQMGEVPEDKVPFFSISLQVPPAPIFKSTATFESAQVHICDLLDTWAGNTTQSAKCMSFWKLPKYLILHLKRFSKNSFFVEKNETMVNFLAKDFDLADYVDPDALDINPCTKYDLVGNVIHEGKPESGYYRVQVLHQPTEEWYEVEDLRVTSILAQQVAVSTSFVQLYRRQDVKP
eukprot:Protomagalhaensia_wolfi_Nauph_80__1911@NODE_21_length_4819_cov_15_300837_g16_i0_p1_GENE_NODE_21_length_4819_cov_15_300837_g16_i0NODE_21_length_4819_cov_15_300837_g16_i0_p1_ORF_typecomplete_len497_score112_31UCH/PF00443_29/3_3e03UCH/PF00443_29/5_5e45zfUBP/PF02148_19/3_2e11UCH_1/PF13423_6/7_8e02UCH_1/PF13423_6/4_1e08_NODE_21_length_4819_cov_15_300837_g16_i016923182